MAKQAKSPEIEISGKVARSFITGIFEHLDSIESARGSYMNLARREREGMVSLYEAMAARGVPQKVSKLIIKMAISLEKIKGWKAELEEEERKIAIKLAKAIGDKDQLSFWDDPEPPAKKPRKSKAARPSNVVPISEEVAQGVA